MDTVENAALEKLFELKKKQQSGIKPKTMYQCIPAQFIDMVSRVGFHTEFAPPDGTIILTTTNKIWQWKFFTTGTWQYSGVKIGKKHIKQ